MTFGACARGELADDPRVCGVEAFEMKRQSAAIDRVVPSCRMFMVVPPENS
jgi:hypothetical protein